MAARRLTEKVAMVRVDPAAFAEFRMAVAQKHNGRTHGTLLQEASRALRAHARRLQREAEAHA